MRRRGFTPDKERESSTKQREHKRNSSVQLMLRPSHGPATGRSGSLPASTQEQHKDPRGRGRQFAHAAANSSSPLSVGHWCPARDRRQPASEQRDLYGGEAQREAGRRAERSAAADARCIQGRALSSASPHQRRAARHMLEEEDPAPAVGDGWLESQITASHFKRSRDCAPP